MTDSHADITWPEFSAPKHVEVIEAVPLEERGLPATTFAVVQRAGRLWPDEQALRVMPDAARWRETLGCTFGELAAGAARVANVLHALGVGPETPVGIIAPNCLGLVPAMLGAQAAGIAVPLNPGLSADHLTLLMERSGVEVVITAGPELEPEVFAKVSELATAAGITAILLLEPTAPEVRVEPLPDCDVDVHYLADLTATAGTSFPDPHSADDVAAIFHTGGTTGVPKLAAHTHRNQVADAWMIAADTALQPGGSVFAALPLFHVNALHVTMLAPLLKGQEVLWAGPLGFRDPHLYPEFWKIVEASRVVTLSAVPTVYAVLAACPVDADISSLRFAVVGASALPAAVRTAFETHTGVELLEGYGLTEGTCASARSFVGHPRPGSVGKRLPYQQMRVVRVDEDNTWADVDEGQTGTLLISGPTVFAGYVIGRDATGVQLDGLGKLRDGWLDTGDLARIDDGFIYLTGRAKDLIIRGGHNIEPAAIEAALLEHPDVADAAAVGRPDPRAGELPVAYVTLNPGSAAEGLDLEAWIADSDLEPAAKPKSVTVLPALPATDVGKPYKVALRAMAAKDAIAEALAAFPDIDTVTAEVVDGEVVVNVSAGPQADLTAVRGRLDEYAVSSRLIASADA